MASQLLFPENYNYVLAVAASSTLLGVFHTVLTGRRRKVAGVPYPIAYVPHDEALKSPIKMAFNCAQKSHANFTENYPVFLTGLVVTGLTYPTFSASLGAVWVFARGLYAYGYARVGEEYSKNGKGRMLGAWGALPQYILALAAVYTTGSKLLL